MSFLDGQDIVRWVGTEMALCGGEPCSVADAAGQAVDSYTPVQWTHESIPYLQFTGLDIHLANGSVLQLNSQLEDGTGYHGLFLLQAPERQAACKLARAGQVSIFRTRDVPELPLGTARLSVNRQEGPNAVVEATIRIGSDTVRLLAAEVSERSGGELRIVEPDESILVQLNGARPEFSSARA